jgi:hypothetical protein
VHADRVVIREPLREVVALEHAGQRPAGRERDEISRRHRAEPGRVVDDLDRIGPQDLRDLLRVCCSSGLDLRGRQLRSRRVAPRRITDRAGEVADQEVDAVAEVLKPPQRTQHDRMAEMQIRRGRICAELHDERCSARELRS